jgi:pyrroloquinoline quinone biosynthesis protein D
LNCLIRNPDIVWRVEKRREEAIRQAAEAGEDVSDRGTVILMISGMMHQLNLVGGEVWTLCDGSRTDDELIDLLAKEYQVAREELAGDVAEFVNDLLERGWLSHG